MTQDKCCEQYEDIIHLPHPVSKTRPQMPMSDRAAEFSPFAALTGYGETVKEAARLTTPEIELSEDRRAELDRKLEILKSSLPSCPEVTLVFFVGDAKKEGGEYQTVRGRIKKIDPCGRVIVLADQRRIPIDHILDIRGSGPLQ